MKKYQTELKLEVVKSFLAGEGAAPRRRTRRELLGAALLALLAILGLILVAGRLVEHLVDFLLQRCGHARLRVWVTDLQAGMMPS